MAREDGSAKKRIKISKRNTLKNDALNALFMISIKGPHLATFYVKQLINTLREYVDSGSNTK